MFPIEAGLVSCCYKQSEQIVVYQKDTAEFATSQVWQSATSVRMRLSIFIGLSNTNKLFLTIFKSSYLSFILSSLTCKLCLMQLLLLSSWLFFFFFFEPKKTCFHKRNPERCLKPTLTWSRYYMGLHSSHIQLVCTCAVWGVPSFAIKWSVSSSDRALRDFACWVLSECIWTVTFWRVVTPPSLWQSFTRIGKNIFFDPKQTLSKFFRLVGIIFFYLCAKKWLNHFDWNFS